MPDTERVEVPSDDVVMGASDLAMRDTSGGLTTNGSAHSTSAVRCRDLGGRAHRINANQPLAISEYGYRNLAAALHPSSG
jgi:hypothetical protein